MKNITKNIKKNRKLLLGWTLALSLFAIPAMAAKPAFVKVREAQILDNPGGNPIETVMRGDKVTASNQPTNGYFKVRSASGKIGWVKADQLNVEGVAPQTQQPQQPQQNAAQPQSSAVGAGSTKRRATRSKTLGSTEEGKKIWLKVLADYNLFKADDINGVYGFTAMSNGLSYGLEGSYAFLPGLSLIGRVEYLSKGVIAQDSTTNSDFDVQMKSIPLMVGAQLMIPTRIATHAGLSALVGMGFNTSLSSKANGKDSPNETQFSATPLTAMIKGELGMRTSKSFLIFMEGGYRYLKAAQLTPSVDANGSEIFKTNGTARPLNIDFSGLFIGVGVAFGF